MIATFGVKGFWGSISPAETFRLDQLIVGMMLTPTALGLYTAGLAVSNLPRFVAHSIGTVAYPAVARETGITASGQVWYWLRVAVILCGGATALLLICAGFLIPLAFGPAFLPAVESARWLLASSFALSTRRVITDAMRGAGRPEAATYAELVLWLLFFPAATFIGSGGNLEHIAAALAVASFASLATAVAQAIYNNPPRTKAALC